MRVAMGVTPSGESSKVTVKMRADVQEFVGDGSEFLAKRKIKKPRQIEVQHIEHFATIDLDPLDRELPPAANGMSLAADEPQGGQRGIKPARHPFAGLSETDSDPRHVNVAELVQPC